MANQVMQGPVGYSTKSNVAPAAITGATATNLLGTATSNNHVTGTAITNDAPSGAAVITSATQLVGTAGSTSTYVQPSLTNGPHRPRNAKGIPYRTPQPSHTTHRP